MKVKTVFSTAISFALLLSLLALPAHAAESSFSDYPQMPIMRMQLPGQ